MDSQLSLFGPRDDADALALACLNVAWAIVERRTTLTPQKAARIRAELALLAGAVECETDNPL